MNINKLPTSIISDSTRQRIKNGEFWNDDPVRLLYAIEAAEKAIQEYKLSFKCHRCHGKGTIETSCSMCHDSTRDHECDDRDIPCPECK